MELLIEDVFKLTGDKIVFACKAPSMPIPNKSKYEAFIKSEGLENIFGPFVIHPVHVKRTTAESNVSVGFGCAENIELDRNALLSKPHYLVLHYFEIQ